MCIEFIVPYSSDWLDMQRVCAEAWRYSCQESLWEQIWDDNIKTDLKKMSVGLERLEVLLFVSVTNNCRGVNVSIDHLRWRHYGPSEISELLAQRHGVISQTSWIPNNTAGKTTVVVIYLLLGEFPELTFSGRVNCQRARQIIAVECWPSVWTHLPLNVFRFWFPIRFFLILSFDLISFAPSVKKIECRCFIHFSDQPR